MCTYNVVGVPTSPTYLEVGAHVLHPSVVPMQVLVHPRHWKDLSQEELGSSTSCIEYNWRMISDPKTIDFVGNWESL